MLAPDPEPFSADQAAGGEIDEPDVAGCDPARVDAAARGDASAVAASADPARSNVEVLARLDELAAHIEDLQRLFAARILHAEAEGQANARLHSELQAHKNDLYGKLVKPVLSDVLTVREHVLKLSAHHRQRAAEEQAVSLPTFESFADDLAQILEENDVEIRRSEPGALYDPQWHQVVGKVDTDDIAIHRTIATVVGDAYSFQGRPLARQRVTVYDARSASLTGDMP